MRAIKLTFSITAPEDIMEQFPRIFVPIVTSFDQKGKVYGAGIKSVISYLHDFDIHGVWLLGSYGSFPLLTPDERMEVAEIAVSYGAQLGTTTIVNVGSPATRISVDLAIHAESIGADAIAAVVPFYYSGTFYQNDNILDFFRVLVQSVSLPVIFYNNFKATGFDPNRQLIEQLSKLGVSGLKDKGDYPSMAENFTAIKSHNQKAIYLSGTTSVQLQGHLIGSSGVTSGTALAAPRLVTALQSALDSNNIIEAVRLQNLILRVRNYMGRYSGRAISAYDTLTESGVDVGTCRSPWIRLSHKQAREVVSEIRAVEKLL